MSPNRLAKVVDLWVLCEVVHRRLPPGCQIPCDAFRDMDLEGIEVAVLFGSSPFLSLPFFEDKDLACAISQVYNNWLAGYCKADPAGSREWHWCPSKIHLQQ